MTKKRFLSFGLALVMCMSLLTGCGAKPEETFVTLLDEMNAISAASIDATMSVKVSKEFMEEAAKKEAGTEDEEVSMDIDLSEMFEESNLKDLVDENGNMALDIAVKGQFDTSKKHTNVNIGILNEDFDVLVNDKVGYVEIDGIFDVLESAVGPEISILKAFLGDYKYIKVDTSSEDAQSVIPETNTGDLKAQATKDTVTKENDTYTLALSNDYIKSLFDEKTIESLGGINNANGKMSITKSDAGTYTVGMSMNIDNKVIVGLNMVTTPGEVNITFPAAEEILDTEAMNDNMDNMFGEDSFDDEGNYEGDVSIDKNTDWSWDWTEFDVDDLVVGTGKFEKAFATYKEADLATGFETGKADMKAAIAEVMPGMKFDESSYTSSSSNSIYFTNYTDKSSHEVSYYISDGYTSIEMSVSYDMDDKTTIKSFLEDLKEAFGVEISEEQYNTWLDKVIEDGYESGYGENDELTLSYHIYDDSVTFSIEITNYNYN